MNVQGGLKVTDLRWIERALPFDHVGSYVSLHVGGRVFLAKVTYTQRSFGPSLSVFFHAMDRLFLRSLQVRANPWGQGCEHSIRTVVQLHPFNRSKQVGGMDPTICPHWGVTLPCLYVHGTAGGLGRIWMNPMSHDCTSKTPAGTFSIRSSHWIKVKT